MSASCVAVGSTNESICGNGNGSLVMIEIGVGNTYSPSAILLLDHHHIG